MTYVDRVLYSHLSTFTRNNINCFFTRDIETQERKIRNILRQYGFNEEPDNVVDQFCERISRKKCSEAKALFEKGTFIE